MQMHSRGWRRPWLWVVLAFGTFAGAAALNGCATQSNAIAGVPDQLDYNWHVRPILSENCFKCHGNDPKARKAGLRLDLSESAFAELKESPGRYAIVAGNPERSELIRRITATDPSVRMPPADSHKVLNTAQIEILRRWIDEGAEYKPHWAFITPEEPRVPRTSFSDRAVNEIDRFVFARLQQEGLEPSPPADKATLINRVSLTLTGLPPTLAEVDAFVKDTSPTAYEKVVDRLLGSQAYAEHMAGYWMNLSRWAESDGYLDDHHDRLLWPWRDWVIDAFARNMPFDQFATWQLAGDLMPDRSRDQLLATTFLRVGKRTTENGAIDEEYRIEYVADRTETVGTAFLGMTVGCARCHDHKYDPISQRDYYSLSGFFNSADEPGFYAPGHSAVQAGPTLPWPSAEMAGKIAAAEKVVAQRAAAEKTARDRAVAAVKPRVDELLRKPPQEIAAAVRQAVDAATVAYYPFETAGPVDQSALPPPRPPAKAPRELVGLQDENRLNVFGPPPAAPARGQRRRGGPPQAAGLGNPNAAPPRGGGPPRLPAGYSAAGLLASPSVVAAAGPALLQAPIFKDGAKGKALFFDGTNKGVFGRDVGYYDRTQPFSIDAWFFLSSSYELPPAERIHGTGKGLPYGIPLIQHRDDDNSGGAGYRLQLEDGHLWLYLAHSRPANMIALKATQPMPVKRWVHVTLTYDGSSTAAGTRLYLDGKPAEVEVDHDSLTRSMLPRAYSPIFDNFIGLTVGSRFREKSPDGSGIDELRVFDRALTPLEVVALHTDNALAAADRTTLTQGLTELLVAVEPAVVDARKALTTAREEQNGLATLTPQVLVFGDAPKPRPTYRLDRGVYSNRAEEVPVRAPNELFAWNDQLPVNRVGLAQWLFDPRNPLTARVFVNRMWQRHFGLGLVETAEDFGQQGSLPSHPELLDWLALRFVESKWDVKALHKLIVMSGAYQQSSDATDQLLERDSRNILLARGPRLRMPAEMVRDNALAASGLLVRKVGGPSVYPYQPENIWNTLNSFWRYPDADEVPADEHHRRTVYTFIKRNAMHPGLQIFDAADPSVSIARRRTSNTPLQALELMNDPQFIEAYRQIAQQTMKKGGDADAQLRHIYRVATRRDPTGEQLTILREAYAEEQAAFTQAPRKAGALLGVGLAPADASLDQSRLAALTHVTALVMNTPDAYSIR